MATWAGTAALTFGVLFGASGAFAASAPANTLIGNQAVAGYRDSTGNLQSASSNLVQTQVQQVGSFTLVANNTLSAAGGNTVYASHTLTNTGNGTDSFTLNVTDKTAGYTFSKVEVYLDANGDGVPDSTTPLCSSVSPALCTITPAAVAGNGGTFKFVVAYTVPAGTPNLASDNATVIATPVGAVTYAYAAGNLTITNTDTVNVTTLAAFSATKSLSVPAVAPPPGGTWPMANVSGPRSSAACLSTTYPVTQSATCQYSVYTINYKNTGGAAGKFYMQDTLPVGFTYVTGSAVWSSASGVALTEASGGDAAGIDFVQSGQQLSAQVASVGPNVSGSVSFVVLVNNTATVGTGLTTNTATYEPLDSTHPIASAATATTTFTNPAAFVVTASYGVVLGNATASAVTGADSPANTGTPNGTPADLNTAPSIASGGSVKFKQQLFNTGNASDTFNLTVSSNGFPANTTFTFFAADGVTPLLDTNGDGVVDSGSMALNSARTIVVQATIPGSVAPGATSFSLVVLATSVGDTTQKDASNDTVTKVVGIPVDLTNSANGNGATATAFNLDVGAGPSPQPTTTNNTAAGTGTIFNLFVKNNDASSNTYNLSASQTSTFPGSLPAGWTVKFVATGTGCAGAAVTTVGPVATTAQATVDACVTPPASAPVGVTTNIYFNVTSTAIASTGVIVSDSKTDAVKVNSVALTYSATLTPNNVGQVSPGGTVVYAHTLNTTGAQACGTYTLNGVQSPADIASGWTYALFLDVNGDGVIDAGDTPMVAGSTVNPALPAGGSAKILVRVFAPGGATPGLNDTVTVTATFATANGGNCGTPNANDVSTVVTGQIRVVKTQAIDANCDGIADGAFSAALITGKPGQCVVYKVVATNEGTAPITNLSINDAVPPYTTLATTQPAAQCVISTTGVTGTTPAYVGAAGATTVSCGSAANAVAPGATVELDFAVQIN